MITTRSGNFRRTLFGLVVSGVLGGLAGCATTGHPGSGGGGSNPGYVYLTGNWQIETTNTTAPVPFTSLGGFINEQGDNPGVDHLTTTAPPAQPGDCYLGPPRISLSGGTQAD